MSTNRRMDERDNALGTTLFLIAAVAAMITMFVARAAALRRASYKTVWWLVLPVSFVFGHVFALCFTVALGFTLLLFGITGPGNYLFGNSVEFAMLSTLAGDKTTVPTVYIMFYQYLWWKLVVRGLTRHCAISVYDWAIQTIGRDENTHPYYIRQEVSARDINYAQAEGVYLKSGSPPLLGTILVTLAGGNSAEYYNDFACMTRY